MELIDDKKAPQHSFNTATPMTYAELMANHHQYEALGIRLNNDTVLVDFDEQSDAADALALEFNTLKVKTTRGFHLYFRKPKGVRITNQVGKITLIGIPVDYKITEKAMGTIKINGVMREIENGHYIDNLDSLPELPFYLFPSKTKDSLLGMADGQGRNPALFKHLCNTLEQYPKFKQGGILDRLANYINHLVFKEPLGDEEFKKLIKSVLNQKMADNNLYLDPSNVVMSAKYLARELKIHRYQGRLYYYDEDEKRYITDAHDSDTLLKTAIYEQMEVKANVTAAVVDQFHLIAKRMKDDVAFPVQLANGYILDNGEPIKLDAEFTPLTSPTRYDPNAYCERADKFLDFLTCNDKDLRMVVEEMLGHVLMTHDFPHKTFFLTGEAGGNGKSTFIEMVRGMVGSPLVSSVPLKKFDNDDTSLATLAGKLVNLADDVDASYLENSGNFKSLASGDTILVRPIYSGAFELQNTATLIFTCNETPRFKDRTGGLTRRMQVIPCENTLAEKDFDLSLKKFLRNDENSRSYVLNLAIQGAKRLKENGTFTRSERVERATKEYLLANDLIAQFFDQHDGRELFKGHDVKACYNMFVGWCVDELGESAEHITSRLFGRSVKKYTGLVSKSTTRAKQRIRIYEDE